MAKGKTVIYDTFEVMLLRDGYDEIKIKDLVKESGVNRNTFYYHFLDMDCFLEEYITDSVMMDVQKCVVHNEFNQGFCILVDYVTSHKEIIKAIVNSKKGYPVLDMMLHTRFRMDIQNKLFDYESKLKTRLPRNFITFYANGIADEYLKAFKVICVNELDPEVMKKVFQVFVSDIPYKLQRTYKALNNTMK